MHHLTAFLGALPERFPATVLLDLHRPVEARSHLREVLGRASRIPVRIARSRERLEPGVCYIGEPAWHLAVGPGPAAALEPDHVYRNRTVDLLFTTAAAHADGRTIGIVFAGSLSYGAKGLADIVRAGGAALVVDPDELHHWGMPEHALEAVPDAEVFANAQQIARRVDELVRTTSRASKVVAGPKT